MNSITIERRYNGPDNSGNGGYVSGLIAEQLPADVRVRRSQLQVPPPLETALNWRLEGDSVSLVEGTDVVIGTSTTGTFTAAPPECPTPEQAAEGLAAYPGFREHPFDRCFTCGTARGEGDGLRLFTGPIDTGANSIGATDIVVAGPWRPHPVFGGSDGRLSVPVTWAALDCPGGWAVDFAKSPIVLGRMTARIDELPVVGAPYLSVGGLRRREGRKFFTETALYTLDGELMGRAEQIWFAIDIEKFR